MSCRLTIIGSRRRVDATLPAGVPVVELLSDVLDMLAENTNGRDAEWGLVRVGGRALDLELSLSDQGVGDGTMLFLRDLADAPAAPAIQDYAEQVAVAVDVQPGRWTGRMVPRLLVAAAGVAAVSGGLAELAAGDASSRAVVGGAGAVVCAAAALALVAGLRSRMLAVVVLFSALPLWIAAGIGIAGLGRATQVPMLAAALGAVAVGALVAIVIAGEEASSIGAGILAATLIPALVAAGVAAFGGRVLAVAALVVPLELGALALAAPIAVRLAGIAGADASLLAARLSSGRHLLASLVIGIASSIAASCVVLTVNAGWLGRILVVAAAIAVAIRARHFRFAAEIVPLLAVALIALAALEYPLAAWLAFTPGGVGDLAALLVLDTGLLVSAAIFIRRWEIVPMVRQWLGPVEAAAIAATVPLALGAIGAFDAAVRFARGLG